MNSLQRTGTELPRDSVSCEGIQLRHNMGSQSNLLWVTMVSLVCGFSEVRKGEVCCDMGLICVLGQ
jgi:hypothetical protein